jgi:GINS complex subunit 2
MRKKMEKDSNHYLADFWKRAKFYWTCKSPTPIREQETIRLTGSASDDLSQPVQLRSLLKDLREVRQAKIRLGLQSEGVMRGSYLQLSLLDSSCKEQSLIGQVTNLTPLELTELKPFLVKAMGMMQGLEPRRDDDEELGASQM